MTTATIHPPRRIEDICPPWCEGHSGMYQGWETRCLDGRQVRDHAERGTQVSNASVMLVRTEEENHTLGQAIVELFVDSCDVVELTAAQARELAAVLVEKAAQAEAQR